MTLWESFWLSSERFWSSASSLADWFYFSDMNFTCNYSKIKWWDPFVLPEIVAFHCKVWQEDFWYPIHWKPSYLSTLPLPRGVLLFMPWFLRIYWKFREWCFWIDLDKLRSLDISFYQNFPWSMRKSISCASTNKLIRESLGRPLPAKKPKAQNESSSLYYELKNGVLMKMAMNVIIERLEFKNTHV